MSQIDLNGICKSFKVSQRPKGNPGLLKGILMRKPRL
jgi:hypothetical protein